MNIPLVVFDLTGNYMLHTLKETKQKIFVSSFIFSATGFMIHVLKPVISM